MKKLQFLLIIFAFFGFVLMASNCSSSPDVPPSEPPVQPETKPARPSEIQEGIYIGILSFAGEIKDLTNGKFIYLDEEGRNNLLNILSDYTRASGSGTALCYAVHKALANLSGNESALPKNMNSINLLTFTDGLDNASTSLALPAIEAQNFGGKSTANYADYLKEQIADRRIRDKPITSFSVGVMGSDIEDHASFIASLENLASNAAPDSGAKNFYELNDFSELSRQLQDIANNLTIISRDVTFNILTPSYQPGTKIRMTFDVEENSISAFSKSVQYMEGEVAINGSSYELINITYSGNISSSSGTSVPGILNGTEVSYVFNNFVISHSKGGIKQWSLNPDSSLWQRNSEYVVGDSLKIDLEKKSSIIYLVLDNSRSLADNDILSIRNAIENFINLLYLKLYPGATVPANTQGNHTIVNLQNNIWKEEQLSAGEFRYYRFPAKAGQQYFVKWNDSYEGDDSKTCDILVTIYREDTGASIYFETDSGYNNPPQIAVQQNTDILIEVKGYATERGTYAIMYFQQPGARF
jgi:hypothetical protein